VLYLVLSLSIVANCLQCYRRWCLEVLLCLSGPALCSLCTKRRLCIFHACLLGWAGVCHCAKTAVVAAASSCICGLTLVSRSRYMTCGSCSLPFLPPDAVGCCRFYTSVPSLRYTVIQPASLSGVSTVSHGVAVPAVCRVCAPAVRDTALGFVRVCATRLLLPQYYTVVYYSVWTVVWYSGGRVDGVAACGGPQKMASN